MTIERSARGAKPCSWCYPRCDAYGTRLRNIVWSLSEFTFLGKEMLDGRPAMTYSFRTAPKIPQKYKSDEKLKFLLKFAIGTEGALWIDEEDRIAFRCEGRNYKTVVRSPGFLVGGSEIRKGSRWEWHLEKSESTWFPTEIRQKIPYLNRFRRRIRETVWRFDNFRMIQ